MSVPGGESPLWTAAATLLVSLVLFCMPPSPTALQFRGNHHNHKLFSKRSADYYSVGFNVFPSIDSNVGPVASLEPHREHSHRRSNRGLRVLPSLREYAVYLRDPNEGIVQLKNVKLVPFDSADADAEMASSPSALTLRRQRSNAGLLLKRARSVVPPPSQSRQRPDLQPTIRMPKLAAAPLAGNGEFRNAIQRARVHGLIYGWVSHTSAGLIRTNYSTFGCCC